jgi:S-layer homology domain
MKRPRLPVLLAVSAVAIAASAAGAPARDAYGTADTTMVQVVATQCTPSNGTVSSSGPDGYVYPTSGPGNYDCGLDLPTGAKIVRFDAIVYDASDSGNVQVTLVRCDAIQVPGISCDGTGLAASTGTAAAPQIGRISKDISAMNLVVDKTASLYSMKVFVSSNAGDVQFRAAEVYYRLQVSTPTPGTQTFGDVPPTNLYYKGIEALAASGITSGCGNGNFCPNQYVTRGEIATFFARALGLHFPN